MVCVFVYRNIDKLENTIRSVSLQRYPLIDLVVSDDHSFDDVDMVKAMITNIVGPYSSKFRNLSINVNDTNLGTVKHVNKILKSINGEYLCLLGSGDCLYQPDVLSSIAKYFKRNQQFQICFSKRKLHINDNKNILLPPPKVVKAFYRKDDTLLNLCCRDVNYITTIGTFFKRTLFEANGYFDEEYILLEDAPYILNLLFKKVPIGFYNDITCIHEGGGISNQKGKNSLLELDSLRTLREIKYPHRYELNFFTRRVIIAKYLIRVPKKWNSIIKCVFLYPDAVLYLIYLVLRDWIKQKRYLSN